MFTEGLRRNYSKKVYPCDNDCIDSLYVFDKKRMIKMIEDIRLWFRHTNYYSRIEKIRRNGRENIRCY